MVTDFSRSTGTCVCTLTNLGPSKNININSIYKTYTGIYTYILREVSRLANIILILTGKSNLFLEH